MTGYVMAEKVDFPPGFLFQEMDMK